MFPAVTVLVLSMHDESLYAERALRAGARGYIMKREAAKKVIQGIRSVLAGQLYVSDKIAALMAEKFIEGRTAASTSPIEQLSNRELEVFQLLGLGHSTRQIADHLHVGFKTVQAYCARHQGKTQACQRHRTFARSHSLAGKPAGKITRPRVGFYPTISIDHAPQTFLHPTSGMATGLLLLG